jgi:hypothetical protein
MLCRASVSLDNKKNPFLLFVGAKWNWNFALLSYLLEYQKQALQYKPKGRRNIGRPRKRWTDQFHFEDQGTGNMPNPSRT